jgi:uncharacterized protein (TIGR03000 family)
VSTPNGTPTGGVQQSFSSGNRDWNRQDFDRRGEFRHLRGGYPYWFWADYYPYGYWGVYPWGYWAGYYPWFLCDPGFYFYLAASNNDYYQGDAEEPIEFPQSPYPQADEFASWSDLDQRVAARIFVPTADAQIWIEGEEMADQGTSRSFVSPQLEPGKYTYIFRARWTENGKTLDQTKKVSVRPGDRISVDFTSDEKQMNRID